MTAEAAIFLIKVLLIPPDLTTVIARSEATKQSSFA